MTEALRDALGQIAGKNDLSGVSDTDLASAACNALHECELIARAALAATPAVGGEAHQSQYIVEGIILRRLHEARIEGYTIEMAKEIVAALAAQPASPLRGTLELIKRLVDNKIMTDDEILGDIKVEVYEALSAAPPEQPAAAPKTDWRAKYREVFNENKRLRAALDGAADGETGV